MNKLFLFLLFLLPAIMKSQTTDSLKAAIEIDSLIKISRTLSDQKKFDEAFTIVEAAQKMSESKFGKDHLSFANCIFNKGRINQLSGKLKETEPFYIQARDLRGKILGKEHKEYASVTNNLAILYRNLYRYDESIALFKEVADIRAKTMGKDHVDYAAALNNLATVYSASAKYEDAESNYLEVKKIRESKLGKQHPEYARILNNLAELYTKMGRYQAADQYFQEATGLFEKLSGKESPEYCWVLNNYGFLCQKMGNYELAESYLTETNRIRLKSLGRDHPDYASGLVNLANLYNTLGNYEKAAPIYEEASEIEGRLFGKNDPRYGQVVNNLAVMYTDMNFDPKAEALFNESKNIIEHSIGKENADYTQTLNNLAIYYIENKKYAQAETYLTEANEITKKRLGLNHPKYANTLEDLALLKKKTKNLPKALELSKQAVEIYKNSLGTEHNRFSQNLINLAQLEGLTGDLTKAEKDFETAADIQRRLILRSTRYLSERELASFTSLYKKNIDLFFSFNFKNPQSRILNGVSFNNALLYKGFLLNASLRFKNLVKANKTDVEQFDMMSSSIRRLNDMYSKPKSERDSMSVLQLEFKVNELEKELTKKIAGLGDAMKDVNWLQVKSKLMPNEAAIEFVSFRLTYPSETDSILYAAVLIKPNAPDPEFIPLFEEKSLDSLLTKNGERSESYVKQLYSLDGRGAIAVEKPLRTLADLIWKPFGNKLTDVKTIYFASTGLINRLNIGAIPLADEEIYADRFNLINLGSTRQLIENRVENEKHSPPILFGGIIYDADSMATLQPNFNQSTEVFAMRRNQSTLPQKEISSRGGTWNFLKWTSKEINSISALMNSASLTPKLLSGYDGSEENFKSLGNSGISPYVIHAATHGFFFTDPKDLSITRSANNNLESNYKISENPMIRSGIVLAGGNYAWKNGKPVADGMDDGIVTALEISQMDLSQTELVVLSACETGLGDIKGNEGVYGLQRAFRIAGARNLIMSLWQVPDKQTSLLMTAFYKNWLENKKSIPEAFRSAQRELREAGLDVYQWGGFVLVQ